MKPFTMIAIVVFALVALVHVVRLWLGWAVTVQDWVIPVWVSVVGFLVPALLAVMLYRENRK